MKKQTLGIIIGLVLLTAGGTYFTSLILAFLLAINCVTFVVYGLDKWNAIRGGRRTPEATLHLLSLFGGSPAAAVAQPAFRHKTKKRSFRRIFFAIIAIQVIAIALWFIYR